MLWLVIALLFVMLFMNFSIMVTLLVSGLLMVFLFAPDINLVVFVQQLSSSVESYVLLAIPMFIFSADIIVQGRTANRLLDFVNDLFGHIRGGTGIVAAATKIGRASCRERGEV